MITFAEPLWFVVGAIFIILLVFWYKEMQRRRYRELERFASPHLLANLCANVSARRRTVKKVLILVAIACLFSALARPQYGFKWIEVKRKGIDILFAVDTSKSMLAEDVRPNRLQRAKFAILDFVGQLEGDRVGILPFAGSAFLMCPMTIDYSAFEDSLGAIDTTIIPRGGTDLATAISEAESVLSNDANHKILVLLTDGENLEGDVIEAAKTAADKGMTIYTVGVGTTSGELIPLSRNGKTGFVKDASGKFITSQLDEKMLTEIAEATDGLYVPLGTRGEGLETIYQEKLSLIPKEELAEKRHKVPLERFVWPLGAAIVVLMLEFLVGGRKSRHSLRIPFIKTAGRRKQKAAALFLFFILLSGSFEAEASKGEDAYGEGDFLTAAAFYDELLQERPTDARLHFNYGTAAYKNNLYEDAAKAFNEALKTDDLGLQAEAYYNRGNALFQRGNETLQTDPQHTMDIWQQAIDSFDGALQLDSVSDDARYNLELVKKKLEELQEQQEKQEQEDQQQQDQEQEENKDQDKEQNKDQKGDQGQEEKNQDSSGQDQQDTDKKEEQKEQANEQKGQQEEGDQGAQPEESSSADEEKSQAEQEDAVQNEADKSEEKQQQEEQQAQARDQERRLQGKMTREEARQLLNSLKDEEGELNFVPSAAADKADNEAIRKDW
jgi:Ca-activated chloride channel homolog